MSIPEGEPSNQEPHFRETEPVALWSARIALQLPYTEFEQTVSRAAQKNGQRYTGFITKDGGTVTSFTRTRYPRKKYGVASIEECQEGMAALADEFGSTLQPEPQQGGFRVVLGLQEGYDNQAPIHSVDEVQHELPTAKITPAEVFAVRHTEDGTSVYTEPVAVIEAPIELIGDVYGIGDRFRQERFTIEDFEQGIAYVVETRFCTEPD